MPNWCDNGLTVESDDHEELMRFKEHAKGNGWNNSNHETPLDWNKFLPMPDIVVENGYNGEGKLKYPDGKPVPKGYDWENKHWGTKWGVSECEITEYSTSLTYG